MLVRGETDQEGDEGKVAKCVCVNKLVNEQRLIRVSEKRL